MLARRGLHMTGSWRGGFKKIRRQSFYSVIIIIIIICSDKSVTIRPGICIKVIKVKIDFMLTLSDIYRPMP